MEYTWHRMTSRTPWAGRFLPVFLTLFGVAGVVSTAHAQPTFSKRFLQSTIGPGSHSRLEFTIQNTTGSPVSDLAFTDNLPAAVTIATPANASTDCGFGVLSAPEGGSTILLSGGRLGAGALCRVLVDVTSSVVGVHNNLSGDLTSSGGNSGTAQAMLTVAADRPGFSAQFSPSSVVLGGQSRLTFTIDNSVNARAVTTLSFSAALPVGLVVADPSLARTTCTGGNLAATAGGSAVTYSGTFPGDATVAAGAVCTVSLDVEVGGVGTLLVATGELSGVSGFFSVTSGFASSVLASTADPLQLTAAFIDDPAIPGGSTTLRFSITNRDRRNAATNIAFTDDLDAALAGLVATGLPLTNPCGAGSTLSGTSTLSLTGGRVAADGGTCTFDVPLAVPASAATGVFLNTTSQMTSSLGTSAAATSRLVIQPLTFTKTFLTDPLPAGDVVSVEFTVTNGHPTESATDISFTDNLAAFVSGTTVTMLPAIGFCGAGSALFASFTGGGTELVLTMSGGSLAPGASCTATAELRIPSGTATATYLNRTEPVSATLGGRTIEGGSAMDTLTVLRAPGLSKAFDRAVVARGEMVDITFLLSQGDDLGMSSSDITFSDDLDAMLPGAVAVGLPQTDVCGSGSSLDGTSTITLADGALGPGESCMFTVSVQIPTSAPPGPYTNNTSDVSATVAGNATTAPSASASLTVSPLEFSKTFIDDPVLPGQDLTLRFEIENVDTSQSVNSIFFSDNLNQVVPGLSAVTPLPSEPCGAGSSFQAVNPNFVLLIGGSLAPAATCSFDLTVRVPASAAVGNYQNLTSTLTAVVNGTAFSHPPALDTLTLADVLGLAKAFSSGPLLPGAPTTLTFTLSNLSSSSAVTGLTFTDDLSAALAGLTATGLPVADVCGAGSSLSGTSLLTFSAGSIPAGGSCEFDVSLQVPPNFPVGAVARNTTSTMTGSTGGLPTQSEAARADAQTQPLRLTKIAAASVRPEESVTITYRLENLLSTTAVSDIRFADDFDDDITGMTIDGLPSDGFCGSSAVSDGTFSLSVMGVSLDPGASCMFEVSVALPAGAAPGSRPSTSSEVTSGGFFAAPAATALIDVRPSLLLVSQIFDPASIGEGEVSSLAFTAQNPNSVSLDGLTLSNTLPTGLRIAASPNASTDCGAGALTASAGGTMISLASGEVGALASCTVRVDVTGDAMGSYTNVPTFTSVAGISQVQPATLSIEAAVLPDSGVAGDGGADGSLVDASADGDVGGASGGADCSASAAGSQPWWLLTLLFVTLVRRRRG